MAEPFCDVGEKKGASVLPFEGKTLHVPLRFTLPQKSRLKKKREFVAVYEQGRRAGGRLLTLWALPAGGETRVGFVAARRVGPAWVRNRAKRLLREAFRLHQGELANAYHLVMSARPGCDRATSRQVEAELLGHLARVGCLQASADRNRPDPGHPGRRSSSTRDQP